MVILRLAEMHVTSVMVASQRTAPVLPKLFLLVFSGCVAFKTGKPKAGSVHFLMKL